MEEPSQFMLDTCGHCFLCLQKVDQLPGKTDLRVRDDEDKKKRIFSFRDICHYLKMDLGKVFSDSGALTDELEKSELKGSLCGECGQLSQLFSGYFLQLQEVQTKMGGCLKSIYDRMGMDVEENNGRVLEEFKKEMRRKPYTLFQLGIVERLRKTTLEKCDRLFEEAPPPASLATLEETEERTDSSSLSLSPKPISEDEVKQEVLVLEQSNIDNDNTTVTDDDDDGDAVKVKLETDSPTDEFILPDDPQSETTTDDIISISSSSRVAQPGCSSNSEEPEGPPGLRCKFCGKSFTHPSNCRRHMKISCPSRSRSKTGNHDEGPKKTSNPKPARRRLRLHTCRECGKTFGFQGLLLSHISATHLQLWKFPCDRCGKKFNVKRQLLHHRKWMHPEKKSKQ